MMNPRTLLFAIGLTMSSLMTTHADAKAIELHGRISEPSKNKSIALTLDACGGRFDKDLIKYLIDQKIPATIFVTKKWLDRNAEGISILKSHLELFDIEDHGENHVPAVIGIGRKVYGIPGQPDAEHLRQEVENGAQAITKAIGIAPRWYRGATATYDLQALIEINKMGYKVAGFSINADSGASLSRFQIQERLKAVKDGDVIIAHINKPDSDSAEGLSAGLQKLHNAGFTFVRLDQVDLIEIK